MKSQTGFPYRQEDFYYLTQRGVIDKNLGINDRQMWDELNQSLITLDFKKEIIHEIWSIVAAVLLIGNLTFDSTSQGEKEPC
jgi:myosin heavy subunit